MAISYLLSALLVLLSFTLDHAASYELKSTGSTLSLDGILYYLPASSFKTVPIATYTACALAVKQASPQFIPITVVNGVDFSATGLEATVENFGEDDDVWTSSFLAGKGLRQFKGFQTSIRICYNYV